MSESANPLETNFLHALLPHEAILSAVQIDPTFPEDLFPCERSTVSAAVPSRKSEFAAGRRSARRALAGLGMEPVGIPTGSDRRPIWPLGIVGSISHSKVLALAVVSRQENISALGIDCEGRRRVPPSLADRILRLDESQPEGLPPHMEEDWLTMVFSAKEAVYKAIYPAIGRIIDFKNVGLAFDETGRTFTSSQFGDDGELLGRGPCGIVRISSRHVFSIAWIPMNEIDFRYKKKNRHLGS